MRHQLVTLSLCATAFTAVPINAIADARVEMASENGSGVIVYKIKDGRIRFEQSEAPEQVGLYDTADGSMTMMDLRSKQYFRMDKKAADEMAGAMSQAMEEMQKRLAQLPPEQAEQMRRFMPELAKQHAPKFTVERLGKKIEVADVPCEMVRVSRDGVPLTETCIARASAVGISDADHGTMRAMMEAMEDFSQRMGGGRGQLSAELGATDGVPVMSRNLEDGRVTMLRGVSTDAQDPDDFRVPEDFTPRQMPAPQF